jgi:hypothetical protein
VVSLKKNRQFNKKHKNLPAITGDSSSSPSAFAPRAPFVALFFPPFVALFVAPFLIFTLASASYPLSSSMLSMFPMVLKGVSRMGQYLVEIRLPSFSLQ